MQTQIACKPRPGADLQEDLFAAYVRSAVRRILFIHSGMTEQSEVVRKETTILDRAKSLLQEHVRAMGARLPAGTRDQVLRHMMVVELAGYDELSPEERARALVDVLRTEGLTSV